MNLDPPDSGIPINGNGSQAPPPPPAEASTPTPPTPPPGESSTLPEFDFPDRRRVPRSPKPDRRRRRWYWWVIGISAVFALTVGLTTTYPESSRAFCGSCHTAEEAAQLHAGSIHAEVTCLACHGTTHGLLGGIAYVPTLLRETVHQVTGLSVAAGVLQPAPCTGCHAEVEEDSPLVIAGHPGPDADCMSCHGQVAHPGDVAPANATDDPHPDNYTFLHGRDAVGAETACAECHGSEFCSACHIGTTYPHPTDWTAVHGAEVLSSTEATCSSCHATSFCAGCHGTDIPHPDNWTGLHFRAVEQPQASACATCHSSYECAVCHVKHSVHTEQRLYDWDLDP